MSVHTVQAPFDQNDKKYRCLCGNLHIRTAARIVSVLIGFLLAIYFIFSLTRSATVAFHSFFSLAFSVVIFGFLIYGTFKEKRMYIVPFMIFQAIYVFFIFISLVVLLIMIGTNSHAIVQLAEDYYNVDPVAMSEVDFNHYMSGFIVVTILFVCINGLVGAYFLEIIYRFWLFLKDRESSFNFNFDTSSTFTTTNAFNSAAVADPSTPPAYGTLS